MRTDKKQATVLRVSGYSYSYISEELGISKSTLSSWFKDFPYKPNEETLKKARQGQIKYGQIKKQERINETKELLERGKNEVGDISDRDLFMVGLGLWLGEGSKTNEQIRLANSDPNIIKLWIKWLYVVCKLSPNNITVRMHLYKDSDENLCFLFWQRITQLNKDSFRKTQFDSRHNKRPEKKDMLAYGTLHVSVISANNPDLGVKLHRRLKGWVSAII